MNQIDFTSISDWIQKNLPEYEGPYDFSLVPGGRSNLTFKVGCANGQNLIFRRPPISHVLPTAHDMAREYRILKSLARTEIPVPTPLALCTDLQVCERPFYLMEYIDGNVLTDKELAASLYNPQSRRDLSLHLIQILANLHLLNVDRIGLGDLGKRDGYIQRQLTRWHSQYRQSSMDSGLVIDLIDRMYENLQNTVPSSSTLSLVHGDFRLDNTIVDSAGSIKAVLDWEIATLGDPLADLGLLLVYWIEPDDKDPPLPSVTMLDGFMTRGELLTTYGKLTGIDVSNIEFYAAFGYWKLACILAGVYARYQGGAEGGDRSDVSGFAHQVKLLATKAERAFHGDGFG